MNKLLTVLVLTSLLTSPAWGGVREAAFASSADRHAAQTSMYAGATYRVSLDRRTSEQRGRASLKLAGMSHVPGSSDMRFGQGLELTGGQTGKPALHLAGQDIGQLKRKANLSGTGTALIIGGVILLGVVAAVVISDYERSQRCIGEEGDCD
jgi:hypothetical protein